MKSVIMHVFDFTRGNWRDNGNYLELDGNGLTDGYFDTHVEGDEVIKPELAAYIADDPDGEHVVDAATFDGWLSNMDESNNYHWYEMCLNYLSSLTQEQLKEMLGDELEVRVDVSFETLGYIDFENDEAIKAELDEMRSECQGQWAYDTYNVQEAQVRAETA